MLLQGSCHCGALRCTLDWPGEPETLPARACTCTFCTRHGAVWTAHPEAVLSIDVADPALVSRYAFGTRTAEFLVCRRCGAVPVCISRIEGRLHAVVNVNTLEAPTPAFERAAVSFDGEATEARLRRRTANWIGRVELREA